MQIAKLAIVTVLVGILLGFSFITHADTPKSVRAKFDEDVGEALRAVKEHCNGAELSIATDLDTVDSSEWGNDRRVSPSFRGMVGACVTAIDSIDAMCTTNANSAKWKPLIAQEVKGVRCLFTGHQAQRPKEPMDVYVRRNMSYDKGVLTILIDLGLGNVKENAAMVVMRGLADKGAPVVKANLYTGQNGEQCSVWSDCKSAFCSNKLCSSCTNAKTRCRSGTSCHAGSCMTAAQIRDFDRPSPDRDSPSRTEIKSGSCSRRGAVVIKNDSVECCSKRSKLVKGTRTCM